MRSIAAAFLMVGCLFIVGCGDVPKYVEKTDLSAVEIGAGRDQVEAALGAPTI